MARIAVYYRVSTDTQDLAMQEHAVEKWLREKAIDMKRVMVFQDHGVSGSKDNRPGLQALRDAVDSGNVDTVVVYSLDRLSRKAITAMRYLLDWMHRDISFYAVSQPILQLGKDNPLRLTIVALFSELAQIERQNIVARVNEGLAAAKARGQKLGPPNKITSGQKAKVLQLRREGKPVRAIAQATRVSKSSVHAICKEQPPWNPNESPPVVK